MKKYGYIYLKITLATKHLVCSLQIKPLQQHLKFSSPYYRWHRAQFWFWHLTTITTEPGFLGNFVLLLLKTCSLYHEKLFIQVVNDISSQVFNNFFSASDIMEAVRGRFRVWYEGCVIQVILLRNKWIGIAYELIPLRGGGGHIPPRFG